VKIIDRIGNCKISALKFQSPFYSYFFLKRLLNNFKYTETEACIGRVEDNITANFS